MKNVYKSVDFLDKRACELYGLSEEILMENAAFGLLKWIKKHLKKHKKIQIICGCGNNAADGLTLSRILLGHYKVSVFLPFGVKSKMAKKQLFIAKNLGVKIDTKIKKAALYVDCLFGSGLNRALDEKSLNIIDKLNSKKALKLSCDIPSGILNDGTNKGAFKANATIVMGGLKESLFSDFSKDFVGQIFVQNLGIKRSFYEQKSDTFLLNKKDLKAPKRAVQNVNKGTFGHLLVISGEKKGAALISSKAAFSFGAGLVSVLNGKKLPHFLMKAKKMPPNTSAICCGMGLGVADEKIKNILKNTILPMVLDADILKQDLIKELVFRKNVVLTPHPKEFSTLCKLLDFGDLSVSEVQQKRLHLAREFSKKFPCVLVLKGANTIIAQNGKCFINAFGSSMLAKGGSGDVLSGLIASVLAQHYDPLDAAICGVLAHSLSAKKCKKNSYALMPNDIINNLANLRI